MHALTLLLAASLSAIACAREIPPPMGKLVPYTEQDQARLYDERPPIMDAHYLMPTFLPQNCPDGLIQKVFPSATVHFIAATEYCKDYIAPARTTITLSKTLTAWVVPGGPTRSAELENPNFDPKTLVSKAVSTQEAASLSSACTCLVGAKMPTYTQTKTLAVAVETHTLV